jgi:hypothetical protein
LAWLEQVLDSPELVEVDPTDPELTHHVGRIKEHGNRAKISVFVKNLANLRKSSDKGLKAGKLDEHESRDTEEKSDEGNSSRPP